MLVVLSCVTASAFLAAPLKVPRPRHAPNVLRRPAVSMATSTRSDDSDDVPITTQRLRIDDLAVLLQQANQIFDAVDTNKDGVLSRTEVEAHISKTMSPSAVASLFSSLDGNSDGVLSREEFQFGFTRSESAALRRAFGLPQQDSESPSQDARTALADELFAAIDSDSDGEISSKAFRCHLEEMAGYSLRTIDSIMSVLDVDNNGKLSRTEMRAAFGRYEYSALRLALGIGG